MATDVSADSPVGRVLAAAGGKAVRAGRGWLVRCPAHADGTQSLKVEAGTDGRALLTCHAGCDTDSVVSALGLMMKDLFVEETTGTRPTAAPSSLTLADFAAAKQLPLEQLRALGVADSSNGRSSVTFEYRLLGGGTGRTRLRTSPGKDGFRWLGQGELSAYTPDRCALAREERFAVLVEGESDTLTLLCAGIPAIGCPGANTAHVLTAQHFEGLSCAFVWQENDAGGKAFVAGIKARLDELELTLPLHVVHVPSCKDPSAFYLREPGTFADRFHALLKKASEPPPGPLDHVWRTLGEWNVLKEQPPPRRWLLERPDEETNGTTRKGVLAMGKTGLLVAPGGVGKTLALVQLAIAVATGRTWLDHFHTPNPGRVLLVLAEEDIEEIHRRVYSVTRAMRLTDEQLDLCAQNIVAMPLAGVHAALVESHGGRTVETELLGALRKKLGESEWCLVILDPLSRFAGGDTEKDNAAATRFVEAAESLAKVKGSPAVLIAHHTSKPPRKDRNGPVSADDARGASALGAGVRWVANLEAIADGGARLTVTKSNYAPKGAALHLIRDFDQGGYLRTLTSEELRLRAEAGERKTAEEISALQGRIRVVLEEHPGLSKDKLAEKLQTRKQHVRTAVDNLAQMGLVEAVGRYGFKLSGDWTVGRPQVVPGRPSDELPGRPAGRPGGGAESPHPTGRPDEPGGRLSAEQVRDEQQELAGLAD